MSLEQAFTLLQGTGVAGVVLVICMYALRAKDKQVADVQEKVGLVQEKRIADAQTATAKLLELVAKQHEQQELMAKAIDSNADAIREHRLLLETILSERGFRAPLTNRKG